MYRATSTDIMVTADRREGFLIAMRAFV